MLAVGYNDAKKIFVVRNSWGDQWVSIGIGERSSVTEDFF